MLKKWFNTYAEDACRMEDIMDKDILEISHGEVTRYGDEGSGSDTDEKIFGIVGQSDFMGHILLPCPVVNINFLYGEKPILPKMLGMSRRDIEKVMYFARYIVVKSNNPDYPVGTLLGEQENIEAQNKNSVSTAAGSQDAPEKNTAKKGIITQMGAEAIETLLAEKGFTADNCGAIHHVLPFVPMELRYVKGSSGTWHPTKLNWSYGRVLNRAQRIRRLEKLEAPEIIMRIEKRMLQEFTDSLILNRLKNPNDFLDDGYPADSLRGIYEMITKTREYNWKDIESLLSEDSSSISYEMRLRSAAVHVRLADARLTATSPYKPIFLVRDRAGKTLFRVETDTTEEKLKELEEKYQKESKEAAESLNSIVHPIVLKVLENYFPDYAAYYDVFENYAYQSVRIAADNDGMEEEYDEESGQSVIIFDDAYDVHGDLRWYLSGAMRVLPMVRDRILPFLDPDEEKADGEDEEKAVENTPDGNTSPEQENSSAESA